MGLFDNFLQQVATGDQIRDFKHAARLFVDNNYALSPKYGWLYHVFIDVNPELTKITNTDKQIETGMLVKNVDLPKYSVATKTFNEYNRPNIVQTKINYDSVTLTFHDDQSDTVRSFWYDYFTYYYRDADIGYIGNTGTINPVYHAPSKYSINQRDLLNRFGYSPRSVDSRSKAQYIHAIRIYSLHQKRFSEYTLVNPIITQFNHGTHDAGGNGILEATMQITYETMLYASGYVTKNTVKGFADLHYDKAPSPLTPAGGGTNSIMGPGGILNAVDDIVSGLGQGNFGQAAFTLLRAANKNKNVDLRNLAKTELITVGMDILNGANPKDRFFIPTSGSRSSVNFPGIQNNPGSGIAAPGSIISNGSSINLGAAARTSGINIGAIGSPSLLGTTTVAGGAFLSGGTLAALNSSIKGASSNSTGAMTGGALNQVYQVNPDGQVTTSVPQSPFDFLGASLAKLQASRKAKVDAQAAQEAAAAANRGTNGLSELPQGVSPIPGLQVNSTAFTTGTNKVYQIPGLQTMSSAVGPYSDSVVTASPVVAASEAEKFIVDGNPQEVTPVGPRPGGYGNFTGGTSTPPAPPEGTTI